MPKRKRNLLAALVLVLIVASVCCIMVKKYSPAKVNKQIENMFCKTPSTSALDYPPLPSERTINFPENEAVGLLYIATGTQSYGNDSNWEEMYGPATGEIKLPEGTAAFLEIEDGFSSFISELKPNDVQAIDFSAPFDKPFELYTNNQTKRIVQLSDEDLEPVKNLNGLYQLVLHNTTITDKALIYISELKSLRLINLWNTKITDDGLVYLAQLPFLDTIYLGATDISDEGLKHLSKLTRLQCLELTGSNRKKGDKQANTSSVNPNITDAGIQHLSALTSLKYLHVADTDITDKGLDILSQLSSLHRLEISGTKTTEEGVRKLQAALPDCKIIHEYGMRMR
ncbi:MAG: hypothetical protein FVQ84_06175 [Planctomycetes bacterium]|nr:hypothetical protein [Planctomycetota bacterium]